MKNYTTDDDTLLELARYDIFRHLLPVIVCMILFGAAGIVGNILAFIFYAFKSKRSTTVMLIGCLAMTDLIVCVLFIPNIIEIWVNVTYVASCMCKLVHFVGLWTIATSALILWVVAIDRHRKICRPFGRQMTLVTTKYAVTGIVVFGFALSVRNFANFDSVNVDVKDRETNVTVHGRYCTTRDDARYIVSVAIFTVIDFVVVVMVCLTLAVAYCHIIYTIFKLKKIRKDLHQKPKPAALEKSNPSFEVEGKDQINVQPHQGQASFPPIQYPEKIIEHKKVHFTTEHPLEHENSSRDIILCNEDGSISYGDISSGDTGLSVLSRDSNSRATSSIQDSRPSDEETNEYSSHDTEQLPDEGTLSSNSHAKSTLRKVFHRHKKSKRYSSAKCSVERSLTFKMLAVSIVFLVCFTPYFIVKILMREVLKSGEEFELNLLSQIALRLPYMNSVFNPLVYCVFNPQFRLYIKSVILGLVAKCFQRTENLFKS